MCLKFNDEFHPCEKLGGSLPHPFKRMQQTDAGSFTHFSARKELSEIIAKGFDETADTGV